MSREPSDVNGQQTLFTVPEPVEGNSSASLREVFESQQDYKTTSQQVLVRNEIEILKSNIV